MPRTRGLRAQFAKFAAAGGAGTAMHYLVLITLVGLFQVAPGHAAFAGAAAGACVIYLLNRRYTFVSQRSHRETLPRFAAMAIVGALLNGFLVGALSAAGMYFLLAQVFATVVVLVFNFIVSKIWIFQ